MLDYTFINEMKKLRKENFPMDSIKVTAIKRETEKAYLLSVNLVNDEFEAREACTDKRDIYGTPDFETWVAKSLLDESPIIGKTLKTVQWMINNINIKYVEFFYHTVVSTGRY